MTVDAKVTYAVNVSGDGRLLLRLHVEVAEGSGRIECSEYEDRHEREDSLTIARRIAEAQGFVLTPHASGRTPEVAAPTLACKDCGRQLPDTDEHRCGHACDNCQGICYAQCGHAAREHECRTCMEAK